MDLSIVSSVLSTILALLAFLFAILTYFRTGKGKRVALPPRIFTIMSAHSLAFTSGGEHGEGRTYCKFTLLERWLILSKVPIHAASGQIERLQLPFIGLFTN